MDPESDFEVECAYEEILKKIGRNLLLFQQAEHLIRSLMTLCPMPSTGEEADQRRDFLLLIIEERGQLVHHSLSDVTPESLANYRTISLKLDRQQERILPEVNRLLEDGMSFRSHYWDLLEFYRNSDRTDRLASPATGSGYFQRSCA